MSRFVQIIIFIVFLFMCFFISSYYVKAQAEQKVDLIISNILNENKEIKNISYKDLNINIFDYFKGQYSLTDLVITPRVNPDYALVIGRLSVEKLSKDLIKIRLDEVFIHDLNKVKYLEKLNFDPSFYFLINYQKSSARLNISMVIDDDLENLQTRVFEYSGINLTLEKISLKLKTNALISSWLGKTPSKILILNNPKIQSLEDQKKIKKINLVLKFIHDSSVYQEWLAYLLEEQSPAPRVPE